MSKYMDVKTMREEGDKTYWTKCGVAFPTKNGGWSIRLDSLPVNGRLVLMEPYKKDERKGSNDGQSGNLPF